MKDGRTALEYLETILRYLSATAKDISDEQVHAALEEAFKDDGDRIMAGFVEKWIEQGKQEGKEEGQQALRSAILNLLQVRFGMTSSFIVEGLGEIGDLDLLQQLHNEAATADSLAAFEQYLSNIES